MLYVLIVLVLIALSAWLWLPRCPGCRSFNVDPCGFSVDRHRSKRRDWYCFRCHRIYEESEPY
jgi:hypothetical protein